MDTQLAEYLRSIQSDDDDDDEVLEPQPTQAAIQSTSWFTVGSVYSRRFNEWTSSQLKSWCLGILEAVRTSMSRSGEDGRDNVSQVMNKSKTDLNHILPRVFIIVYDPTTPTKLSRRIRVSSACDTWCGSGDTLVSPTPLP